MVASVCAIFHSYTATAQSVHLQDVSLWHLLGFRRKPPGHDCLRDLLLSVDSQALSDALMRWITEGLGVTIGDEEQQAIAIDGKVLIRENTIKPASFL